MRRQQRAKLRWLGLAILLISAGAQAQTSQPSWTASISPATEEVVPPGEYGPQMLQFGEAVAADGGTILAGMPSFSDARGRVAVFTRQATGEWLRSATLQASDAVAGDAFGQSVALRGSLAIVTSGRAIYVFKQSASGWTQRQRLAVDTDEWFNAALDFEQIFLTVGAGRDNGPGAVYFYTLSPNGTFQRRRKLSAPTGAMEERFGSSVAVWGDTIVVGAPGYDSGKGAAYVYSLWKRGPVQMLNASGTAFGGFGSSVDVSYTTLVVGAPSEDIVGPALVDYVAGGAAYVFNRNVHGWQQAQRLRPPDGGWFLNFGANVQLSGKRIAIAAPWNSSRWDPAYVYLYERSNGPFGLATTLSADASLGVGLALTRGLLVAGVPWDPYYSIGYALISELPDTME